MVAWVTLELDVEQFDHAAFEAARSRAQESGIAFTTLAALGNTAEHRRALYELNKACSADIPERGQFYTYEEYVEERISVPTFDPHGVVLALCADQWVGMTATSLHPDKGYAFSEMTGVIGPYRGRGLSLALKTMAIARVRSAGYRRLVTVHHPGNASAIAMNRRLGFTECA